MWLQGLLVAVPLIAALSSFRHTGSYETSSEFNILGSPIRNGDPSWSARTWRRKLEVTRLDTLVCTCSSALHGPWFTEESEDVIGFNWKFVEGLLTQRETKKTYEFGVDVDALKDVCARRYENFTAINRQGIFDCEPLHNFLNRTDISMFELDYYSMEAHQPRRGILDQFMARIPPHFVFLTANAIMFSAIMALVHYFSGKLFVVVPLVFFAAYGHVELTARYGKGLFNGPAILCVVEVVYIVGLQSVVIWYLRRSVDKGEHEKRAEALLQDLIRNHRRNTLGFDEFELGEPGWNALNRARNTERSEVAWSPATSVSISSEDDRDLDDWDDDWGGNGMEVVRFDLDGPV